MDNGSGAPQASAAGSVGNKLRLENEAMEMSDDLTSLPRRALLKTAGIGVGASLVAGIAPTVPANAETDIWSAEYWAHKGGVKLNLWRKRAGAPKQGETPLPAVFLVHGSSNSARASYDLTVPGKGEYSLMNVLARAGFDVWTMDHDGYGRSGSSGNSSDIASGVEDLKAAMPVVMQETGQRQPHFFGTSSGGIRAAAYAQAQPEHVGRLVLSAFTYKGNGAAEIERRRKRIEQLRASTRRKRDAAMVRSIFTRDGHADLYDPAVAEAVIAADIQFGQEVPSGTYLDMAANLPIVDPAKITSPVLMLRGEFDGNSTNDDLLDFYRHLPNGDRQFVILPQIAHSPQWSKNRHLFYYALRNFLTVPEPLRA
jgi:alpha-beta hydrolase superfamily lysophospholipase